MLLNSVKYRFGTLTFLTEFDKIWYIKTKKNLFYGFEN